MNSFPILCEYQINQINKVHYNGFNFSFVAPPPVEYSKCHCYFAIAEVIDPRNSAIHKFFAKNRKSVIGFFFLLNVYSAAHMKILLFRLVVCHCIQCNFRVKLMRNHTFACKGPSVSLPSLNFCNFQHIINLFYFQPRSVNFKFKLFLKKNHFE